MIGSSLTTNSIGDIVVTMIMGLFGYVLKIYKYPRAPLLLGMILGSMAENYLHLSLTLWGLKFFFRPLTLTLLVLLVLSVLIPIYLSKRNGNKEIPA
jgi:TctA family transporter